MILKQRKYKEYNRNEISLRNDDVFKIALGKMKMWIYWKTFYNQY